MIQDDKLGTPSKKTVIFSDIVTKGCRGQDEIILQGAAKSSDKMSMGGVKISVSPFPRLLLTVF